MSFIIAAVLIIVGIVGAVVLVMAIPTLFGLMAADVAISRREPLPELADDQAQATAGRIFLERGFARAFVIFGGIFWAVAVFAGLYSFRQTGAAWALLGAFVPFVATVATLIVGWYYERAVAILLAVASVGVVYWGIVTQFEMGVWILMTLALIGPMMTAAVLFWLARRDQVALELHLASLGELAPAEVTAN